MSIVNPAFSFSVTATINDHVIMFLVNTGSALTILRRDIWEKCKAPEQQLVPWCQNKLVGAEGSRLHVFGSAVVGLSMEDESIKLSVVVIDPLLNQCTVDLLHGRLITGTGHVVTLCSQGRGQHVSEHGTVNINKTV